MRQNTAEDYAKLLELYEEIGGKVFLRCVTSILADENPEEAENIRATLKNLAQKIV